MPHSFLAQKLFYFITDTQTNITFFVNNKKKQKHVYYPIEYQTMKSSEITKRKNRMVLKMLWFSLIDKDIMTKQDRKICQSKVIDIAGIIGFCFLFAHFCRLMLFKTKIRPVERYFTGQIISSKWVKTVFAYSLSCLVFLYSDIRKFSDPFFYDMAYEYQYAINNKKILESQINTAYQQLCSERFDRFL